MCEGGRARVRQEVIKNRRRGIGHAHVEGLAGGRGPSSQPSTHGLPPPDFRIHPRGEGGRGGALDCRPLLRGAGVPSPACSHEP